MQSLAASPVLPMAELCSKWIQGSNSKPCHSDIIIRGMDMVALTNSKSPPKDPKIINSSYRGELSHRAERWFGYQPCKVPAEDQIHSRTQAGIPLLGQSRHPRC